MPSQVNKTHIEIFLLLNGSFHYHPKYKYSISRTFLPSKTKLCFIRGHLYLALQSLVYHFSTIFATWLVILIVLCFSQSTVPTFFGITMNSDSCILSCKTPVSYILFASSVIFLIVKSPPASTISTTISSLPSAYLHFIPPTAFSISFFMNRWTWFTPIKFWFLASIISV